MKILQLGAQVPQYGLVTTANCKQLMLFLEDRHGEAGVDNQDLGLTLLRAAQVNAQPTLAQPCCRSCHRLSPMLLYVPCPHAMLLVVHLHCCSHA